jgi:ribosomal protein S18 acetylase RimI-like enzyme
MAEDLRLATELSNRGRRPEGVTTTYPIHDLEPQLAANRAFWSGWRGSRPDSDPPIYRTDLTHGLLNGVVRVRNQPLDEAIDDARQQLAGTPWSWWVGDDSDPGTAEGLIARGAGLITDMPVMAIDATTVTGETAPADFTIATAATEAEIQEYVQAYAEPLGFAGGLDKVVDREIHRAQRDVVRLAGVVADTTVATCTVSLATEVGALYCIATDPRYRRRGIATALTLEALRIVRESGRTIATLQASSQGEPVYRRIGFETVARYRLFHLPA